MSQSSFGDRVRAAQNPQEALEAIADALDAVAGALDKRLLEPKEAEPWGWSKTATAQTSGGGLGVGSPPPVSELLDDADAKHRAAVAAMANADARTIDLPPPSEEKAARRRMFADQQLKLNTILEKQDGVDDWIDVYVKGGPYWLYSQRRDIVMGLEYSTRQAMVADLEEDNPELAYQMGLDALKQPAGEPDFENGSGALAVGTISGGKR